MSNPDIALVRDMLWNETFIKGLSDKGLAVWANGTVGELVDEMRPYGIKFKEIATVCDFIDSNLTWFERVIMLSVGRILSHSFVKRVVISKDRRFTDQDSRFTKSRY